MYKSGKSVIEWFHARSVRGMRRDPCAAFVLLTLTRRFSNRCDADLNAGGGEGDLPAMRANFRNGPRLVGRETGALFLRQAGAVRDSVSRIMTGLSRCLQRERPGRSYPRRSMRPRSKWQNRQAAALIGVAPFARGSGTLRGGRHVSGGRRRPRDVPCMAAMAARTFNPEMKALYVRLRERGKHHRVAVTAVMRKLVVTANVLLRDRRMWEDRTANAA